MKIIITGTPGTGKTEVSKVLAKKLKANLINVNELIDKYKFFRGIDRADNAKIINLKELEDYLRNHISSEESFVIESHLLCELDLDVDYVIILRTHPNILRKRLSKRNYSKEKIESNISCEILDYCLVKSELLYKKIFEINTTNKKSLDVANEIIEVIKGKKKTKHIDWSKKIFNDKLNLKKLKDL
ncbi:adenylate kinase family protein [Candidatus Micrarchaeota archaeon]|nr:adenylate kinase family protein [Candidatus Micrarchaeota archaeon]